MVKHSTGGPIDVDLSKPAQSISWNTVEGIILFGSRIMLPFLKLFGSEDGNGVSPFAMNIDTPE